MCLLILGIAFPRAVLLLLFFLTDFLSRAYQSLLIPVLGFFFLPLTTIVYAWLVNNNIALAGINLLFLILAIIIDLGGLGGGEWHRRRRYYD